MLTEMIGRASCSICTCQSFVFDSLFKAHISPALSLTLYTQMTTGADVVALVVTGVFSMIFISLTFGTFRIALAGDAAPSAERLLPTTAAPRLNLLGVISVIVGEGRLGYLSRTANCANNYRSSTSIFLPEAHMPTVSALEDGHDEFRLHILPPYSLVIASPCGLHISEATLCIAAEHRDA